MTFQLPRDSLLVIIFPFSLSELVENKHCTTAGDRGGAGLFREIADNCRKSLSFAPISRNSRENGAKFINF